jgi:hypothetical protein
LFEYRTIRGPLAAAAAAGYLEASRHQEIDAAMPGKTRTTLTLDPDVVQALERRRRVDKRPFRDVVNDALRAGLAAEAARGVGEAPARRPLPEPWDGGGFLLGDVDPKDVLDHLQLLDDIERYGRR